MEGGAVEHSFERGTLLDLSSQVCFDLLKEVSEKKMIK
jgi:hypothetical protein